MIAGDSSALARRACPCCGLLTLVDRPHGTNAICRVCRWEDDLVQFNQPDRRGGPNKVSLNEARENFRRHGVSDPARGARARPPRPEERP